MIFRAISIITVGQTYLEMLSPLYLIDVTTGAQRALPADIVSASRAAEASEACLYILNRWKFCAKHEINNQNLIWCD